MPDAVAPPPRHPRFPLVDGVRAIAVLGVVTTHAAGAADAAGESLAGRLLGHLGVGVAIFFVISGFLLYRPFIASRTGGAPPPSFPVYGKRRFLRIYPAYWLALTVLVLVPGLMGVYGGEWAQQYALVQWLPLSDGGGCTGAFPVCGLAQTWSLVVEVTFYAALPLYVLATARLAAGRPASRWMWSQFAVLGTLAAISLVLGYFDPQEGPRTWIAGTFAGYMLWFGLGMAMAVASVALEGGARMPAPVRFVSAHPSVSWATAAAIYVVLCLTIPATFLLNDLEWRALHLGFGLIGALVLAPAVFGDREGGMPRRFLAHPVVAWLGLISYGIFLWHFVAAMKLGDGGAELGFGLVLPGTLAIAVGCAALSYYLVERPILRFKYRPLFRRGA